MGLFVIVGLVAAQVAAAPAVEVAPKKAEKKICKVDTTDTGSRMRKRVCMTQVEWEKRDSGKSIGDLKTIGAR